MLSGYFPVQVSHISPLAHLRRANLIIMGSVEAIMAVGVERFSNSVQASFGRAGPPSRAHPEPSQSAPFSAVSNGQGKVTAPSSTV